MNIKDFISNYSNHPVLFVGTGFSLRYLNGSYTWDGLLKKVSFDAFGDDEYYYDIKSQCSVKNNFDFTKVATILEKDFNKKLSKDRNGSLKFVNDKFYEEMKDNISLSRFKIYISFLLNELNIKSEMDIELSELKKSKKNIASIITTNYDCLIEEIFGFNPLIGNNILLSNSYGSVYKIHGSVENINSIIITEEDYSSFHNRYELIRAQLLSLFMHNPIVFLGYSVSDDNIKTILKTIFTYVEPNSAEAEKIRSNFLLIEYNPDSDSTEVVEHDIDIDGYSLIRINKIKTDNFKEIYSSIGNLDLPVSVMDIRKVQSAFKDITSGSGAKIKITEDLDNLSNSEKMFVLGSRNSINYKYHNVAEILKEYFSIIEENNFQIVKLIDEITISSSQWFPIYGFNTINPNLAKAQELKEKQENKITSLINRLSRKSKIVKNSISSITTDVKIVQTRKCEVLLWNIYNDNIELEETKEFLLNCSDKLSTEYRKVLCFYDFKKYK